MGGAGRTRTNRATLIEQWRRVTAELDPDLGSESRWEDEAIDHFLHAFRPDGARLADAFAGQGLDGVVDRLRAVFACAGPETGHMYFVVSQPEPITDDEIVATARDWADSTWSAIDWAGLAGDDPALPRLIDQVQPVAVEVAHGAPPAADTDPIRALLYEALAEMRGAVDYTTPAARPLIEPLYMLACNYELVGWLLHPVTEGAAEDVFAPAARLWRAGVTLELVRGATPDALSIRAWRSARPGLSPHEAAGE